MLFYWFFLHLHSLITNQIVPFMYNIIIFFHEYCKTHWPYELLLVQLSSTHWTWWLGYREDIEPGLLWTCTIFADTTPRNCLISYQKKQLKYIFGVSHITQFDSWTTQTVEVPSRNTFYYPLKTNSSHHWSTQCMFCPQSWWPHGQWRAAWQNSPPSQSSLQCTNAWSGRACRYRCTSGLD